MRRALRFVPWIVAGAVWMFSAVGLAAEERGAVATDEEMDVARLAEDRNTAVVTASGAEEQRALASANVTSIGWDEISQRGYHSLAEILGDVLGLYVVDDLVLPSVGVRGVTGGIRAGTRIVKTMINGVAVNFRPDLTAFLGPEYIPVEMIERVEVAKGPLSALYGANAFLATVNVITRGQSTGVPVIAEGAGRVHLIGNAVGYGLSLVGGYDEGERSLMISVTGEHSDRSGLSISKTFAEQDPRLPRYRAFFDQPSRGDIANPLSAFLQYRAKSTAAGTFMLQGGVQRLDSMGEFQLNSVLTHKSRISLQNDWLSLRHEKQWSKELGTSAWFGWSRGYPTRDEILYLTANDDVAFTRQFRYQAFDGAFEFSAAPSRTVALKAGIDFSNEPHQVLYYREIFNAPQGVHQSGDSQDLITDNDQREITLSNIGTYAQAAVSPAPGLHLTGNFRLDLPNLFGAQYSWRAAAAYQWNSSLTTKIIAGRAFQSPSAVLLYGLPGFGSSQNVIGNRTLARALPLNPQVVHSIEAVASMQLLGRLAIEAGIYAQQVDDKIEFTQSGSHFQAKNQGQQQNLGIEVSSRFALGRLTLQVLGSVQRSVIEDVIDEAPPQSYPNALVIGRINVAVPEIFLNFNGQARWVGERGASQSNVFLNNDSPYTLDSYATLDATLSTVGLNFLGGAQTTLTASVRNILDVRYGEPGFGGMDLPVRGRTMMFELRTAY